MIDPSEGQPFAAIAAGTAADIDRRRPRGAERARRFLGPARPSREGAPAGATCARRPRSRRRARLDRGARLRQAARTGRERCHRVRALFRVLRRRLRQAPRRDDPISAGLYRAHAARAAWRDRSHHSVELPAADLRPLGRRRARGRQRLRRQAGGGRVPVAPARRRARRGPRIPRRCAQRRHRARSRRRRRARRTRRYRSPVVHRLTRDGRAGRAALPRNGIARSRSSSAAKARRSCSPMPISMQRCRSSSMRSCRTPGQTCSAGQPARSSSGRATRTFSLGSASALRR